MENLLDFITTNTIFAFLITVFIFIVTIFLVVRQWIGFSMALLLLVFAIAAGTAVRHYNLLKSYIYLSEEPSQSEFNKQITKVVEDVRMEVSSEKENLHLLMKQVEDLFDQMNQQKIKLQQFIEETTEHFRSEEQKNLEE